MVRHHIWKKSAALVAVVAVTALTGCAGPTPPAAAPQGSEGGEPTQEISVLFASAMNNVPMMVAAEQGFWRDRGLNVSVKVLDSGSQIATALVTGAADIGAGNAATSIPLSRAAGNRLVMVGPYHNNPMVVSGTERVGIIAHKDSGIRAGDAQSLVGKTIGVAQGATPESYLKEYLQKNGLSMKDVKPVNLGVPDMPTALSQKIVDAVVPWEPQVSEILRTQRDSTTVVVRGGAYGRSVVGVMVTEDYFAKNRDIVEKYVLGAWEGVKFTREHPEEAAELAQRYINGLNSEDAASGIKQMNEEFDPRISACTEGAITSEQKALIAAGSMKQPEPIPYKELVATDFIDNLLRSNEDLLDGLPELPASLGECK